MAHPPLFAIGMPECQCPADCGGRPEASRRLTPTYPSISPAGARPPDDCYEPTRRGELVQDQLNGRLGVFMERVGQKVYLRPEHGGVEWEADPRWLERPPSPEATS
jgi:hypothetical protein